MSIDIAGLEAEISSQNQALPFSGVLMIREKGRTIRAQGYGLANHAEGLPNTLETRFGMASGGKTFTSVAICQLVESGRLAFDTRLKDCPGMAFPGFDPEITIHHLLTHTSGIADYFDEEGADGYDTVWAERPMYAFLRPEDYLPLFQGSPALFAPGARFSYNNAGFILLGMLIEKVSGMRCQQYIEEHIFKPCGMEDSGYFRLDRLPARSAYGYIDEPDGSWHTNIYSIPIIGAGDGGSFTTAPDLVKFWDGLLQNRLLSRETTKRMLTPQIRTRPDQDENYYGYGIWISKKNNTIYGYYLLGEDPGAALISIHYPQQDILMTLIGNTVDATWKMHDRLAAVMRSVHSL